MEELSYINKTSISNRIVLMRNIFLRLLSLIYLISFISLYRQFQGLWGDEGILPAKNFLLNMKSQFKEKANILNFPTLAWWYLDKDSILQKVLPSWNFGSSIENYFFLVGLVGIIFSFCVVINIKSFHNSFSFFVMWYSYLNFYMIEQIFQYEWDALMMEVGFIAIFFAPSNLKNFHVITPVNNICYYLLRFIVFKLSFSIGMHIFGSKCPYWLSINGLNFYFQSLPLPNNFGVLMHNSSDGIKKLISALGYFIILDLPFAYFLVWRRFNIFAGQLTALFQIFIMLTGNYGYLQLLILVVNLSNFDDYYLRGVIPKAIIDLFELDQLEEIVERYVIEKEIKDKQDEENEKKEKEETAALNEKYKNATEEDRKKLMEEIIKIKKRSFNMDDYDDSPKIEEMFFDDNNKTTLLKETFIFFNVFCIIMIFICFYKFPLNKLLTGAFQIQTPEMTDGQTFIGLYMIAIFIYFNVVIFCNIIQRVKNTLFMAFAFDSSFLNKDMDKDEPKSSWMSKINTGMTYLYKFIGIFIMFIAFMLYFLGNVDGFFSGIGLALVDRNKLNANLKNNKTSSSSSSSFGSSFTGSQFDITEPKIGMLDNGVLLSDIIFQRFHSLGNYTGVQGKIKGVNGRSELEIKYLDSVSNKWKAINFLYKMSLKNKPKIFVPYLPRLDYQMSLAGYSYDINQEPWLAILLGKILEVNPVTMDLLGYKVQEKSLYYKFSAFDRLSDCLLGISRSKTPNAPKKIKIETYLYTFVSKSDKSDKVVKRKHLYEFLSNIEKYALSQIFKTYQLPKIDEYREVFINPFQLIPIVDILLIILLVKKLNYIMR